MCQWLAADAPQLVWGLCMRTHQKRALQTELLGSYTELLGS
jgi:hypothetical protein